MQCFVCVERRQAMTGQFNQAVAPRVEYAAGLMKMRLGNATDRAANLMTKKFACSKAQFDAMRNHVKYRLPDTLVERMRVSPMYNLGGVGSSKSAWRFQPQSGLAVKRFLQSVFTGPGESGSLRIYPEKHAVCIIPAMTFTLRLDESLYASIGAVGQAQIKFNLMGWSPTGECRQAQELEYEEYALQQMQVYMMHLVAVLQESCVNLTREQQLIVSRLASDSEAA